MKVFQTKEIRNLGLVGQRGTGKTTLADSLAFVTGANSRQGSVDDGSSISDFTQLEIDHKVSLSATPLALIWQNTKLNLLDMPGHPDCVGEVITGMQVVGNVCIVVDAAGLPDSGAAANFEIAQKMGKPVMLFVNKLDRENIRWEESLAALKEQFGTRVAPVNIPVMTGDKFTGLIDLLHMKEIEIDSTGKRIEHDIPADHLAFAEKWRENLIEQVAETDDEYLEKFFAEGSLSDDEIHDGLRKASINGKAFPLFFGSAKEGIGVRFFADFMVDYLPSPCDFPPMHLNKTDSDEQIEVLVDSSGKTIVYIYKIFSEGQSGDMYFFRVLSGKLTSGTELINQTRHNAERFGQAYVVIGKDRFDVAVLNAGDLGALAKLKDTKIGDTLSPKDFSVSLERPAYPEPVMDVSIRPAKKGDDEKVGEGLNHLHIYDPSFKVVHDSALKQTLLYGQGNTQIELLVDRLKNDYHVEVELDKPRVPYRETIRGKTEVRHKYKKQSGGRGQFGDVHLRLEPMPRGEGFEFNNEVTGGVIPTKFIPSVEKGVREALEEGPLSGSSVVDLKATVFYGSYHAVDSSDMAFKMAALMGFREGFLLCKPTILEPIYNVTITVPDTSTGDVMGDVSSRRGKILGMEPNGHLQIIRAQVPQSELHNYTVDLRSMTGGLGRFSRELSHYEAAPSDVQTKIRSEFEAARSEA